MMRKKPVSVRLPDEIVAYLDEIQDKTQLNRSKAVELLVSITQDYFSKDQICLESDVRNLIDGRSSKKTRG
jgi:metal-responsive CopG/Arc/MetJ family transcriptional regulator